MCIGGSSRMPASSRGMLSLHALYTPHTHQLAHQLSFYACTIPRQIATTATAFATSKALWMVCVCVYGLLLLFFLSLFLCCLFVLKWNINYARKYENEYQNWETWFYYNSFVFFSPSCFHPAAVLLPFRFGPTPSTNTVETMSTRAHINWFLIRSSFNSGRWGENEWASERLPRDMKRGFRSGADGLDVAWAASSSQQQ